MPMLLEGSCKCGAVNFSVESNTPRPYQLCYCSICRKAGTGGYAINLGAWSESLKINGKSSLNVFKVNSGGFERSFCRDSVTMLWVLDSRWPDLLHPFASAVDTDLPEAPERTHIMLGSKAPWVQPDIRPGDQNFDEYPDQSIEDWHESRGLWVN